jgi:hypothetical protein
MIRVTCETFEWGFEVVVKRVEGLKETPISCERYNKLGHYNTPHAAMVQSLNAAYSWLHDVPEAPEHS